MSNLRRLIIIFARAILVATLVSLFSDLLKLEPYSPAWWRFGAFWTTFLYVFMALGFPYENPNS